MERLRKKEDFKRYLKPKPIHSPLISTARNRIRDLQPPHSRREFPSGIRFHISPSGYLINLIALIIIIIFNRAAGLPVLILRFTFQ